jgi:hypothetical protein
MYHQIALNRRKSVLIVGAFILVWLGLGYLVGFVGGGTAGGLSGAVIGLIIALLVMAYSLLFGKATVLAISGAQPANPNQYPQLHNIVQIHGPGRGPAQTPGLCDRRLHAQRLAGAEGRSQGAGPGAVDRDF